LPARPNFVFIVADDLGYADLGCYGARAQASPTLDRLAANGLRFTDGYANSPVCSPTRFALITGRYQYRLRGAAEEPLSDRARSNPEVGLPPEHPTLPSLLRDAGYRTALIGKWHLGWPPRFGPLKSGYDEFFGPLSGGVDYFRHTTRGGFHDLYDGEVEVTVDGYLTDLLADRAVEFVQRRAGAREPFLLSLHYTAPHWPWETRDDRAESERVQRAIEHADGGSIATYHRMIEQMDEGIGRLVQTLRDTGQLDDTLIVFTSDNGGERYSDNWPFIGQKMDLLEGGIRVPLIAHWPARIRPGRTTAQTALSMDWMATFLDIAGVAPDARYPLDGISLRAVLEGGDPVERDLFWRMNFRQQAAVRSGAWKYLRIGEHDYLFDLAADLRERANVAARFPERRDALRRKYAAWEATMPPIPPDAYVSVVISEQQLPRSGVQ
jgi:arylsulfatase A-like enzyme